MIYGERVVGRAVVVESHDPVSDISYMIYDTWREERVVGRVVVLVT